MARQPSEAPEATMVENVTPTAAWEAIRSDPNAHLVDVRCDAEWVFVGVPDLMEAGKQPFLVPWQMFPAMQVNNGFVGAMQHAGVTPEHTLYFMCRSGQRSAAAATAMQAAGFEKVFNVQDGFEGPPDSNGHRGTLAGWKKEGLPWRQR
jgi:rhodanese-related sulfurtransferase